MATLKQSTAYIRTFLMVDSTDHITGKTGLGAAVTVTLCKNGTGGFSAAGATIAEISSGWYSATLTTTDTNTLGDLSYHCTGTGADPSDFVDQVNLAGNDANVVMIDGLTTVSNNATLNLKKLNIVNNAGDALVCTSSGSSGRGAIFTGDTNGNGISVQGAGSGAGLNAIGGATGPGFACTGGGTSGPGLLCQGGGNGTGLYGLGTSVNPGISGQGGSTTGAGISGVGGTTGIGILGTGGSSSGSGLSAIGAAGNADGVTFTANGSGIALNAANVTAIKAKTDNLPEAVQKNVGLNNFMFLMVKSSNHVDPKTGLTITATRSIDGGAFGACTNLATEVSNGWYKINLSAADLNGTVIALIFSGATADDRNILIKTAA